MSRTCFTSVMLLGSRLARCSGSPSQTNVNQTTTHSAQSVELPAASTAPKVAISAVSGSAMSLTPFQQGVVAAANAAVGEASPGWRQLGDGLGVRQSTTSEPPFIRVSVNEFFVRECR